MLGMDQGAQPRQHRRASGSAARPGTDDLGAPVIPDLIITARCPFAGTAPQRRRWVRAWASSPRPSRLRPFLLPTPQRTGAPDVIFALPNQPKLNGTPATTR